MIRIREFLLSLLITANICLPCTTAIVSGKATEDGRPIIWKHRDCDYEANHVVFFTDGKYYYYGIVNTENFDGREIWGGANSAGFAIINSASYNLKPKEDTTSLKDREGIIMKLALMNCATVKEFEELLKNLPKPLGVEANFGVIDAYGGAAYFETDNFSYKKFDVNDEKIAPKGYLIRTNFSFSGDTARGFGYIRYETAKFLFEQRIKKGKITPQFIIQEVSRSLMHSKTGDNFRKNLYGKNQTTFKYFRDFIPRYSSTSSILIRGIKPGESPENITYFVSLGFPLVSPTLVFYNFSKENYPTWLRPDNSNKYAKAYQLSIELKKKCFPMTKCNGKDYILINKVVNKEKEGILDLMLKAESIVFEKEKTFYASLSQGKIQINDAIKFYSEIESIYEKNFYSKFY